MREIKINGVEYKFNAYYAGLKKTPATQGNITCELYIQIWKDGKQILWKDIKDSYPAEVIARYIINLINNEA